MSEAIWIELIKVLPAFLWIGLAIAALVLAKRLLAQQAHRMTRVESPFVSVDFAQDAIEQAFNRGPETPVPSDPTAGDEGPDDRDPPGSVEPTSWTPVEARTGTGTWLPGPPGAPADGDRTFVLRRPLPKQPGPVTEDDVDLDELLDEDGVQTGPEAEPLSAETPPSAPVKPYPPVPPHQGYPIGPLYPPTVGTTAHRPPSYYAVTTDPQRGLRAATRLAAAADLLQGGAILWVDDHPHWNEPLVRLFRTAGMRVVTVKSTDEALRYLDSDGCDLVITDLHRENDPGDQVAGMALLDRMVARGIPTPAVVFSDNPQVRAMTHPRAAGATNNPEELVNLVVDLVGHRRNAMQVQQQSFFGNR